MFLIEMGQYNANFTLTELKRLKYPQSPFVMMHAHAYIRSIDTWAMEILRSIYQEKLNKEPVFPVWIDSVLFWPELERYCHVLKQSDITNCNFSVELFDNPVWIELEKPRNGNIAKCKSTIHKDIRKKLSQMIVMQHADNLNPCLGLIDYLIQLLSGAPIKNEFEPEMPFSNILKLLFPELIQVELINIISDILNKRILKISINRIFHDILNFIFMKKKISDLSDEMIDVQLDYNIAIDDSQWLIHIFKLTKKYQLNAATNIKNIQMLKELSQSNNEKFIKLLEDLFKGIAYEHIGKAWLNKYVKSRTNQLLGKTIYFFKDKFNDIEAMVFCEIDKKEGLPGFVTSVLANLGYRIDPVRAIREVLKLFPLLFVDKEQTENLWEQLLRLPMITNLPEDEQTAIQTTCNQVIIDLSNKIHNTEYINQKFDFKSKLELLSEKLSTHLISTVHIYGSFVRQYLDEYLRNNPESNIRKICDPEIFFSLKKLLSTLFLDLAQIIKYVQIITEVLILDLTNFPIKGDIASIIRQYYLPNFPVQQVILTSFAMRAYARIFQAMDALYQNKKMKIVVTNQSYFEWLQNLERIDEKRSTVSRIQHLDDMDADVDILFLEFHPNNVVDSEQFQHDFVKLIGIISQWNKNKEFKKLQTIVVDITLNALNDKEVTGLLDAAADLLNEGKLNIILVHSLTKFSQLGLDKRSAGSIIIINNNKNVWKVLNNKFSELGDAESIEPSTLNYFTFFHLFYEINKTYIQFITRNVNSLYNLIIERINKLGILKGNRLQITVSTDGGSCYVGLNMNQLLADVDPDFTMSVHEIEHFGKDLMRYLIIPICEAFNLPLTERMSIGFPLTSVNIVYTSLRFTVGIEEDLNDYAEILAFISFMLNQEPDIRIFFDKSNSYVMRQHYFMLKAQQFISMTKNLNKSCQYYFNVVTGEVISSFVELSKKLDAEFIRLEISSGKPTINKLLIDEKGYHFKSFEIYVLFDQDTPKKFSILDFEQKRLCITTISPYSSHNVQDELKLKLLFDEDKRIVILDCTQEFKQENIYAVFGPFDFECGPLYFYRKEQHLFCHFFGEVYQLNREGIIQHLIDDIAFIKHGHKITALSSVPIEEWDFFIREGSYTVVTNPSEMTAPKKFKYVEEQYIPNPEAPINLGIIMDMLKIKQLIMERDYCCYYSNQGVSIYKRYIDKNRTCYQIDYWAEKNPVYARFFRLLTAIMIKERKSSLIQFSAYSYYYSRFLFNLSFEEFDSQFSEVIQSIIDFRKELIKALENFGCKIDQKKSGVERNYEFLTDETLMRWPSGNIGIKSVGNYELISASVAIILQAIQFTSTVKEDEKLSLEQSDDQVSSKSSLQYSQNNNRFFGSKDIDATATSLPLNIINGPEVQDSQEEPERTLKVSKGGSK